MEEEEGSKAKEKKDFLKETEKLVSRMEKANAEAKELLHTQELAQAEKMLAGKAEAGQAPEKKKEETAKEYADRVMRGGLSKDEVRAT